MGTSSSINLECFTECHDRPILQRKRVSPKQLVDAYIISIQNTQSLSTAIPNTLALILLSYYGSNEYIILRPDIVKIPLKLHRNRGNDSYSRANTHPKNLLADDWSSYYQSKGGFKEGENDWIIFKYDALYLPTEIVINNGKSYSSPSDMRVSVGSGWKWIAFQPEIMHIQGGGSHQRFVLKGVGYETIKANSFKKIKVEFIKPSVESFMGGSDMNFGFVHDHNTRRQLGSMQYQLDYTMALLKQENSKFQPKKLEIYGVKL